MFRVDAEIFRSINGLAGASAWSDALGIFAAKYLIFVMAAVILGAAWAAEMRLAGVRYGWLSSLKAWLCRCRESARPAEMVIAAVRGVLAAGGAFIGNLLFSLVYFRPRPCAVLLHVNNLLHRSCVDKSLPSDHASIAFALAFSVVFVRPVLGSAMLVLAGTVAWGRIFVGVHYPLDVLVGTLVGLVWALVVRYVDSRFRLTKKLLKFWSALSHRRS